MNTKDQKKVYIYKNTTDLTNTTYDDLLNVLNENGYIIADDYRDDIDLYACIGGDGTFLRFIQTCDFPSAPIIGINTGHLGFFQELMPNQIRKFIRLYETGQYQLQKAIPVKATIYTKNGEYVHSGLNEILIRGPYTHLTHFKVFIDKTKIQDFSGDGILFSTPVGSTAYNYSLGGSIISPELEVMQMTPVAPMNTNAYRCFRSSIMYSFDRKVTLIPSERNKDDEMMVVYDGLCNGYRDVTQVEVAKSDKQINLIRFKSYDYWKKLSSKLI